MVLLAFCWHQIDFLDLPIIFYLPYEGDNVILLRIIPHCAAYLLSVYPSWAIQGNWVELPRNSLLQFKVSPNLKIYSISVTF